MSDYDLPDETAFDPATRSFADHFVLWSMRKWVMGHRGSPAALALLENAYARTTTDGAVAHLDALMRAITSGAARRIAVHQPCCSAVSADELLLIDAVALAQTEAKVDVAFLLRRLLTSDGARTASAPLKRLARCLRDGGLRLTVRPGTCPLAATALLETVPATSTVH